MAAADLGVDEGKAGSDRGEDAMDEAEAAPVLNEQRQPRCAHEVNAEEHPPTPTHALSNTPCVALMWDVSFHDHRLRGPCCPRMCCNPHRADDRLAARFDLGVCSGSRRVVRHVAAILTSCSESAGAVGRRRRCTLRMVSTTRTLPAAKKKQQKRAKNAKDRTMDQGTDDFDFSVLEEEGDDEGDSVDAQDMS